MTLRSKEGLINNRTIIGFTLNQILKYIVFASIIILPIISGSVEYLSSIGLLGTGSLQPSSTEMFSLVRDHIWTKLLVDIVLGMAILLYFFYVLLTRRIVFVKSLSLIVFFTALVLSMTVTLFSNPGLIFAGIRNFYPIIFVFIGFSVFTNHDIQTLGRVFILMAIVASLLGILQYFLAEGYATRRLFSIYSQPSTFASVLGIASIFLYTDSEIPSDVTSVLIGLFFILTLLTRSGTGIAIFGTILGIWIYRNISPMIVSGVVVIGALLLPILTGRGNIWVSLFIRGEIFIDALTSGSIFELITGQGFGIGTNTSVILIGWGLLSGPSIISDSLYTSLLLQTGIIGLFSFLWFNIRLFISSMHDQSDFSIFLCYFIPVLLVSSISQNMFEMFPVNILYWLVCGAYLYQLANN